VERHRKEGYVALRIDQIFVLAGGRGTRSADPSIPKFAQNLSSGVDVADFLLQVLQDFPEAETTWVLGEHSESVLARIGERAKSDRIVFDQISGTANSLREAAREVGDGNALVMLADTVIALPLRALIERLPESDGSCFFGRFSDHAWDSDHLVIGEGNEVVNFISKSQKREASGLALALSGITITSTQILRSLGPGDAQEQTFRKTIESGQNVRAVNSSWFLRDTGTPERLQKVSKQYRDGSLGRRASRLRSAIFIDRDGTLIPDKGECRVSVNREEIPPMVSEAIESVNNLGIPIFLVTNQPGIAKGCISESQVLDTFQDIAEALGESGAFIDAFYFCPHHPESGWEGEVAALKIPCDCRKPEAGMFHKAASDHLIDLRTSMVIGDTARDEGAAAAIGAQFNLVAWSADGKQVAKAIQNFAASVLQKD